MGGEWRKMMFSEAVIVNPRVELKRGSEYPFVDMQAVNSSSRCVYSSKQRSFEGGGSRFATGDTLMARITPCLENGKIARFCSHHASFAHGSTEFIVIRGREGVTDTDYAYYLTKWEGVSGYAISQMTGTSGRQRVPTESLDHLVVPIPSLPEQRVIAHILGTLDDKIELNRKMNETLEAMARAIFKSWFVDFDPIPGPHKEWQDSSLGRIPKGWTAAKVSEAFEINPARPVKRGKMYAYVEMASLPTTSARVTDVAHREFAGSGSKFKNGDVLLARITPCIENGKTALVDFLAEDEHGYGSTEFIVFGPKRPLNMWFIYCVTRDQEFRDHAIRSMSGTSGRQRVENGCFNNYMIVSPPTDIIDKFGDMVRPWFNHMKTNDEQAHTLATIRNALLSKLLSGEIRVKDVERFVKNIRIKTV